ncbi:MAG TPA: hypothetical protein VGM29_03860 [Polyangiaceae bacterium]
MMSIPAEHVWLFWDVNPNAIVLERDRRYVLGRVLERGRMADVRWAVSEYGFDGVREFFRAGAHPEISAATRSLWRAVLGAKEGEWLNRASFRNSNIAPWID